MTRVFRSGLLSVLVVFSFGILPSPATAMTCVPGVRYFVGTTGGSGYTVCDDRAASDCLSCTIEIIVTP